MPTGREGERRLHESSGQDARGRERKRGPGWPPQPTQFCLTPNRRPPPLTQTSLSSLPASPSPASCLSLWSPVHALPFSSSTFLRLLVTRLHAHSLTYYSRGIQPSSENTTKPALFMTIQRGRRQYGAASQPAPRQLRPRPGGSGPALDPAPSCFRSR